ncbi:MAG: ATP-binding cassette domain-containing protein [Lachnospiraceae bacterium]|nr:ATP-binding cassette domain-containing protein [Lachnospiraceae bacterium]
MLSVRNLKYDVVDEDQGEVGIIHDISMEVPDGQFVVITGPNGGGKSSLAKCIAGVYQPTGGQILFEDQDITSMSITDRAKLGISFAFQQPVRFKGIEVFDLLKLASGDKQLSVGSACQYLSEVGLCAKDYINREVDASLSGGELKRIEIASVLARKSRLSIFDEPEAGIDLWSFSNLIKAFEKIKRETNGSIVIISHQERILEIADTIIVIEKGRVKASGSREEILPGLLGTESAYPSCRQGSQNEDESDCLPDNAGGMADFLKGGLE